MRTLLYFVHLVRLVMKAGVWGILTAPSAKEWASAVRGTRLWRELEDLERERIAITGKGFE